MAKNNLSNFIASVKMLNIGFINKHIINLGTGVGYSVLVNYQSLVPNLFPLAPPPPPRLCLSIKYRQNRLLCESFLELYDFMIYQHVNKRAKILPLATYHIAIYIYSLIRFTLPISVPRNKSIIFYQNSPKAKLFLQKNAKFSSAGGSAPRSPIAFGIRGFRHLTPKHSLLPQLQISGYAPGNFARFRLYLYAFS